MELAVITKRFLGKLKIFYLISDQIPMKTKILLILLVALATFKIKTAVASDCVNCLEKTNLMANPVEAAMKTFDKTVKATIDEQTALEIAISASAYLNKIKYTTAFNEDEANAHIKNLRAVMAKIDLSVRIRARSQLHCSGIIGRLADKKNSGTLGKEAYHMTKSVMKVDPTYREGKAAFCGAVASFTTRNIVVRKFIETNVDISIKEEAMEAKALIEKEKWQNDADIKTYYQQISKFLS